MSNLNFTSNAVPKVATVLTEKENSTVFVLKSEHTSAKPSTLELKRRLPGLNGTVGRHSVIRKIGVTLDAGLPTEHIGTVSLKLEASIPVGTVAEDFQVAVDDLIGVLNTATYDDLTAFGIIDPA